MLPWILFAPAIVEDEDMSDNYIELERYVGSQQTAKGSVSLGVNDEDTVVRVYTGADIAEGGVLSVHKEDNTDYQNTSGFNAFAVIVLDGRDSGIATRHVKIYSAPTTDSISGATLVFETGQVDNDNFDAGGDYVTTPPLKIQDNHYIVVENVDDSRAGTNNVRTLGVTVVPQSTSLIVERGA